MVLYPKHLISVAFSTCKCRFGTIIVHNDVLQTFFDPVLTEYSEEKMKLCDNETLSTNGERLLELIDKFKDTPHHDKYVY